MRTSAKTRRIYKTKFSADKIIDAALRILREKGPDGVVVRAVAKELGSSTMVIYSHIMSKKRLTGELLKKAFEILEKYMHQERTGDQWIDWGVGYIIFSIEEPELYSLILREYIPGVESSPHFRNWSTLREAAKGYAPFDDLSEEQIEMVMFRRYLFSSGLATFLSKAPKGIMSEEQIIEMIRGTSLALLEGARSGAMTVV